MINKLYNINGVYPDVNFNFDFSQESTPGIASTIHNHDQVSITDLNTVLDTKSTSDHGHSEYVTNVLDATGDVELVSNTSSITFSASTDNIIIDYRPSTSIAPTQIKNENNIMPSVAISLGKDTVGVVSDDFDYLVIGSNGL